MSQVSDFPTSTAAGQAKLNYEILTGLEAYWQKLRHAQRIPARNDVEPHRIDAALPHAFMLQRVAPGVARMRVAGQKLHDLLRMDARGMPVSTFFAPHACEQINGLVEDAFMMPAIVSVPLISPGTLLRPEMTGQMLLLPLRDAEGKTTRILGALVTEGARGNRPRRFTINPDLPLRKEPQAPQLATTRSAPRPLQPRRPDTARPALRLVVNNR